MTTQKKTEKIIRDTNYLAPFFEVKLLAMLAECKALGLELEIFETIRSPQRQNELYLQGRVTEGAKVTNAKAWESLHNYALAADCVFYRDKKWSWAKDEHWEEFHTVAKRHSFETLSFEKPHVQIMGGLSVREMKRISQEQGILALWDIVERLINS